MATPRNHTREFKLQCCRQVATGEKRSAQICREHNLSESVLLRWRKEYEARDEAAFTDKQPSANEALEARIAELERFSGQVALQPRASASGRIRGHIRPEGRKLIIGTVRNYEITPKLLR